METLLQVVRTYKRDIAMEFGIEKCSMHIMRRGKRQMTGGIELPNQEKKVKTLRKGNFPLRMIDMCPFPVFSRSRVETIQTTVLLRTARILRRVLETLGDLLSLEI